MDSPEQLSTFAKCVAILLLAFVGWLALATRREP